MSIPIAREHDAGAGKNQGRAYRYALSSVILWSTVASAFKVAFRAVDYVTLLYYATLVSIAVLLAIVIIRGTARDLAPQRGSLARSALCGFLNPFLYYMVLFKAYSVLPAQEAQPLNYTWPVVIALLAVPVLGDRLSPRSIGALLVSFSGVVVISTRGNVFGMQIANPLGASLAVGSSVVWAAFWLLNVRDERDPVVKLLLSFIFGFIWIAAAVLVLARLGIRPEQIHGVAAGGFPSGEPYAFPPHIGIAGFLGCAYVGCFEMGFTFVLWMKALSLTERTAQVSNLILLSPFLSLFFIRFVVGERILISSVAGLVLIVTGILIQRSAK